MAYTAEQFRATLESHANLAWGAGSHGDRVVAALRIAVKVMQPGVIEQASSRPHNSESAHSMAAFAASIRKALTETTDG